MTVADEISRRAAASHRWGLQQTRKAVRLTQAGHDREAGKLCDSADLTAGGVPARLYTPKDAATPSPLLVYFHGGGFVLGDIDTHQALCQRLAHAGGFRVLSVGYRLAPEHAFPTQVDDAVAAVGWVLEGAAALGGDPARILTGGDSAGAYLAIAASRALPGKICGHVLIYPLLQLDDETWAVGFLEHARVIGRLAVRYIQVQLAAAASGVPSLMDTPDASTPPTWMFPGGLIDPVRRDALDYGRRLEAMGGVCTVIDDLGRNHPHGFCSMTHVSPEARRLIDALGKSVAAGLEPASA